ncbi:hypothetical protein WG66_006713 [Moniliophthora roreri]|nr:hypothetical protein WG66_006713 [Moniliophthora roreri]
MFSNSRGFNINGGSFNNVGGDQYNGNQFSDEYHSTNNDFRGANFNNRNYGDGVMNTGVNQDVWISSSQPNSPCGIEAYRHQSRQPEEVQ